MGGFSDPSGTSSVYQAIIGQVTDNATFQAIALVRGPFMDPLRTFMLPEKIIAMHYVPHGWLAGTLAVPFVLLAAALQKRYRLGAWLSEAVAWLLMNLW